MALVNNWTVGHVALFVLSIVCIAFTLLHKNSSNVRKKLDSSDPQQSAQTDDSTAHTKLFSAETKEEKNNHVQNVGYVSNPKFCTACDNPEPKDMQYCTQCGKKFLE